MSTSIRPPVTTHAVDNLNDRVAHEFSNVLTIVLAKADLLADGLPPDDTALIADLEDLRRAARRGADLTDRMLSHARRDPLDLRDLDLTALVAAMRPTLACLLPAGVELVTPDPADSGRFRVRADESAVQRILLSLVANARDAMPEEGTLTIALERSPAPDDASGGSGETVSVIVRDTGPGIAAEIRDRVFEPFFTTRDSGPGTGLGLSMVRGLVEQHGGTISLGDATERGASLHVLLPALPVTDKNPRVDAPEHEGGLILIAEDEEVIRRSAKRILERYGYTVLLAADGAEAMERLTESADGVNLVISDIVMPHMDGLELHRRTRARGCQTPFLFMSGWQSDEVWQAVADDPALDFLPKPWSVAELVARVGQTLGAPAAVAATSPETVQ